MKHLQNIICFSAENQQRHQLAPERCHCPLSVCFVWLFPAEWHGRGNARGAICAPPGEDQPQGQTPEEVKVRDFWQESSESSRSWHLNLRGEENSQF